jgi:Ase1/PRC1/MAP65 family protein
MFLELETECMHVYRRKVDSASAERAQLRQSLMAKEAELKALVASIGENTTRFKVYFVIVYIFASFSSV